jgi:hypothetical protein
MWKKGKGEFFWCGTSLMKDLPDIMASETILVLDENFPHKDADKAEILKLLNVQEKPE